MAYAVVVASNNAYYIVLWRNTCCYEISEKHQIFGFPDHMFTF